MNRPRLVLVTAATVLIAACGSSATPLPTSAPPVASPAATLAATAPAATASSAPASSPTPTASPASSAGPWNPPNLALEKVADGLAAPLWVGNAGDGSGRLFVIEQAGRIRVINAGALAGEPFLDIRDRIAAGGERGLLGLAFANDFATSGRFFVDYTDRNGDTVVSEFRAAPAAASADPATERILLRVEQPFANHNGGGLAVAQDGTLFIALGDGGSGGDPEGNGQKRTTLLGKLLRIVPDATAGAPYAIPADNPFADAGAGEASPEIWAYGLRNPWRFSFDRATGDLWIGDVGQGSWEEIDVVRAEAGGLPGGGANFGWNTMEGTHCFEPSAGCETAGLTLPVAEYDHGGGRCSVTGGVVARGTAVAGLAGTYLFSDYCAGTIWGLDAAAGAPTVRVLAEPGINVAAFGEDEAGEVYVADIAGGAIYRLAAAP